jgi:hypothetical protein
MKKLFPLITAVLVGCVVLHYKRYRERKHFTKKTDRPDRRNKSNNPDAGRKKYKIKSEGTTLQKSSFTLAVRGSNLNLIMTPRRVSNKRKK